jgi:hypothetical protein
MSDSKPPMGRTVTISTRPAAVRPQMVSKPGPSGLINGTGRRSGLIRTCMTSAGSMPSRAMTPNAIGNHS